MNNSKIGRWLSSIKYLSTLRSIGLDSTREEEDCL